MRYRVEDKIKIKPILLGSENTMYLVKLEEADILKKIEMKVINPFIIDGPLNLSLILKCVNIC